MPLMTDIITFEISDQQASYIKSLSEKYGKNKDELIKSFFESFVSEEYQEMKKLEKSIEEADSGILIKNEDAMKQLDEYIKNKFN